MPVCQRLLGWASAPCLPYNEPDVAGATGAHRLRRSRWLFSGISLVGTGNSVVGPLLASRQLEASTVPRASAVPAARQLSAGGGRGHGHPLQRVIPEFHLRQHCQGLLLTALNAGRVEAYLATHFVNDAVAMALPLVAPPQRAGRIPLPDNPVYHGRQRLSPVMLPIMSQVACHAS